MTLNESFHLSFIKHPKVLGTTKILISAHVFQKRNFYFLNYITIVH